MRRLLSLLKILAGLLLVLVLALGAYVSVTWNKVWDVALPDLHASTDPAVIARGEYLVLGPAHCVECHTKDIAEYDRVYASGARPAMIGGFKFALGPLGTVYSKNITPDPETGIGRYSDPQIARMLRHGVRPDGKSSIPLFMPFGDMSDDDVIAVISFLRAQQPVQNVVPENEWPLFGKVMKSLVPALKPNLDVHPPKTAPAQAANAVRGEYLARSVADCSGCHSPYNEMTGALIGPELSGGNPLEPLARQGVDLTLWFKPPNITPLPGSALSRFPDQATFVARFKNGGRKHAGSPMPWEGMARMTPEDVAALYEFLRTVPPSGAPAPEDPRVKQ